MSPPRAELQAITRPTDHEECATCPIAGGAIIRLSGNNKNALVAINCLYTPPHKTFIFWHTPEQVIMSGFASIPIRPRKKNFKLLVFDTKTEKEDVTAKCPWLRARKKNNPKTN
jgi:hypothetical protein